MVELVALVGHRHRVDDLAISGRAGLHIDHRERVGLREVRAEQQSVGEVLWRSSIIASAMRGRSGSGLIVIVVPPSIIANSWIASTLVGMPPIQYLTVWRLQAALNLRETRTTIAQLAHSVEKLSAGRSTRVRTAAHTLERAAVNVK